MKIKVDEEVCTGCGLCSDNCVKDATDDCPVEAITIIEE